MASGLTWYCRAACRRVDNYGRGQVAPADLFAAVVSGRATSSRTAGNSAIDAVDRPVSHGQIPPTSGIPMNDWVGWSKGDHDTAWVALPASGSPTNPRWVANVKRSARSCLRPRYSRDITVPTGVSMISAISL
jgi:hypothetical protein